MQNQKMGQTLRDDLKQGGFFTNIKAEFKALEHFYLDDERRKQLKEMRQFRRAYKSTWWLFKSLFFHMSSFRRLLLVIAILLFMTISVNVSDNQVSVQRNGSIISILIFLFIIMLEIKDKLLATRELENGRLVQQALMPEAQPIFSNWDIYLYSIPANDVGGDLVDFHQISETEADISLGDVAGKGLAAALFMAKLQATLRAIAIDYSSIDKLVEKVNEIFCRDGLPSRFSSLVYIRLNSTNDNLDLVNAGHHPPYLVQDGNIVELPKGAPAIGLKKNLEYTKETVKINKGDFLFVYSDGLSETRNSEDHFYGEERIKHILKQSQDYTIAQMAKQILHSVETFANGTARSDDLSFAIIRRNT